MSSQPNSSNWRASLHGGHSGEYCEHAQGTLPQILDSALAAGYQTFGVSEHAPRLGKRFLYPSEVEKGWTVEKLEEDFERYAGAISGLVEEYRGRLSVLCGFEAEVVPTVSYVETMQGYRSRFGFDYMVGSVHYVDEIAIDGELDEFERAVQSLSGLERLAVRYYDTVADMVESLRPEVVGHLDLIRLHGGRFGPLDSSAVRRAAESALEVIRRHDCILDLNTAGYRKGLGVPYPAPWLVNRAKLLGIDFCFGDDSHSPADVGAGLETARSYLLQNGVDHITTLTREGRSLGRERISLGC